MIRNLKPVLPSYILPTMSVVVALIAILVPRSASTLPSDRSDRASIEASTGHTSNNLPVPSEPSETPTPSDDEDVEEVMSEPQTEPIYQTLPKEEEKADSDSECVQRGKKLKVYAVGSSTMAGLAFVMRKNLKKKGVDFHSGAKASTGLARPDYYDWPGQIPSIIAKHDPDVFIVSLGTNDNQAVRLSDESWVRSNDPEWETVYRSRVKTMLERMNEGRTRRIIWVGPNSVHGRKKGSRRYRINEMMRDEVSNYEGDTHYIDLYRLVTHKNGKLRRLIQRPSDGRFFKARAKDGVHLSLPALRFVLAERVYDALEPCLSDVFPRDAGGSFGPRLTTHGNASMSLGVNAK